MRELASAEVAVRYVTDEATAVRIGRDFDRIMTNARRTTADWAASVSSSLIEPVGDALSRTFDALGAFGVGVGATGAALAGATLQAAQQIDAQGKLADRLAISVEEFSALSFAAKRAGMDQGTLVEVMTALGGRVAQAGVEGSEAAKQFAAFGIAVRDQNGGLRSAADLLPEIAGALEGLSDAERNAALTMLGGETGVKLATLLGEGAAGFKALTDEARAYNAVISGRAVQDANRLVDAQTDLSAVIGGLARIITDAATPRLADFVEGLRDWLTTSNNIVRVGLERTVNAIAFAFDALDTPAERTAASVGAFVVGAAGAARAGGALLAVAGPLAPALQGVAGAIGAVSAAALPYVAAAAALVLVGEDLYVTAQGGDSVLRRFADALGVGEETAAILNGTLRTGVSILSITGQAWAEVGRIVLDNVATVTEATAAGVDFLSTWIPGLQTVADLLRSISSLVSSGFTGAFGELAGFAQSAAVISEGIAGGAGTASDLGGNVAGDLLLSARQRQETGTGNDLAGVAAVAGPAVSVTVQAGASTAEVAAEVARRVEEQVREQLAAVQGY